MSCRGLAFLSVGLLTLTLAQAALAGHAVRRPALHEHAALVAKHAALNDVPESLIYRVIKMESGGNPRLISKGNYGLMQIRLGTAKAMGYSGSAEGLLDPDTNMTYAVRYLAGAYRASGGNAEQAIRYYQRGYYYTAKANGTPPRKPAESHVAQNGTPASEIARRVHEERTPPQKGSVQLTAKPVRVVTVRANDELAQPPPTKAEPLAPKAVKTEEAAARAVAAEPTSALPAPKVAKGEPQAPKPVAAAPAPEQVPQGAKVEQAVPPTPSLAKVEPPAAAAPKPASAEPTVAKAYVEPFRPASALLAMPVTAPTSVGTARASVPANTANTNGSRAAPYQLASAPVETTAASPPRPASPDVPKQTIGLSTSPVRAMQPASSAKSEPLPAPSAARVAAVSHAEEETSGSVTGSVPARATPHVRRQRNVTASAIEPERQVEQRPRRTTRHASRTQDGPVMSLIAGIQREFASARGTTSRVRTHRRFASAASASAQSPVRAVEPRVPRRQRTAAAGKPFDLGKFLKSIVQPSATHTTKRSRSRPAS